MGIHLEYVAKFFGHHDRSVPILKNVNFSVKDGEIVAIIGESGIGKSTLVNLIAGYIPVDAGSITCDERLIVGPSTERMVVSQHDTLMPWLTVRQNAHYGALVGNHQDQGHIIKQRADMLMQQFGLWSHCHKFPNTLSGGQRRRVELIRAFSVVPRVLLLDEPHSSLDEIRRAEMGQFLLRWRCETPATCIVLVTHDLEEACFLADRVLILGGQPASVVVEEKILLGPNRDASLRLTSGYVATVQRVRAHYYEVRGSQVKDK